MKKHPFLTLILARHAESGFNDRNRIQGHLDSELTARGERQAQWLSKRLALLRIRKIYSSDLGRAMSTTRTVARRLKKPVLKEPRLREIRLGKWEGLTPEEVNVRFKNGYDKWRESPSSMVIPGGETVAGFRRRVCGGVSRIIERERGGQILLVTHGGVIAALLSQWLSADFDKILLNLRLDNTGLTLVDCIEKKAFVHSINDVSHLPKKDRPEDVHVFSRIRRAIAK